MEAEQREERERDPEGYDIEQLFMHSTFEPGKGGVARVPEWLPGVLDRLSSGVLKLKFGESRREDEQVGCFKMLDTLEAVCKGIQHAVRESGFIEVLEEEEKAGRFGRVWSRVVK